MPESEGIRLPGVPARSAAQAKAEGEHKQALRPSLSEQIDPGLRALLRAILYEWMRDLERFGPVSNEEDARVGKFLLTTLMQFEKHRAMHIKDMEEQIRRFVNTHPRKYWIPIADATKPKTP